MATGIITKIDFRLADYLRPRGTRPYDTLAPDLEEALADGYTVYLWSVPNFFMLAGHPDLVQYGRPWSDGNAWYKTAKDCINGKNGKAN